MQLASQKLWFSDEGTDCPYTGPAFFQVEQFPQLKILEENWKLIRDEMIDYVKSTHMQAYLDKSLVTGKNSWKTQSIKFWDFVDKKTCVSCPKTWKILASISGLSTASINVLEPNTEIKPHIGDTNAIIRCHLPLIVPTEDSAQCGFRVMTETRPWTEGKLLLFPDSQRHSAWNRTQHPRLVLLFDLIDPKLSAPRRRYVCCRVLGKIFSDALRSRWKIVDKILGPNLSRRLTRKSCQAALTIAYSLGWHRSQIF